MQLGILIIYQTALQEMNYKFSADKASSTKTYGTFNAILVL
jgi:hypothetical protein